MAKRNVAYDVCDHREDFTGKQINDCLDYAGHQGVVYIPEIGHIVDDKLVVVGPASMKTWLDTDDNAILLHDLANDKDGLYWDGKEMYVLDGTAQIPLKDAVEAELE